MGLSEIGIKIDSCCLKAKDQRTKENATNKSTDLELYKAAGEGSIQKFNDVIHRVSFEKQLSVSKIFRQCTPLGNTLLHLASKFGNETVVKHLIEQDQSLFNKQNQRCDTALHIAARFGHKGIAEALVHFQRALLGESSSSENRDTIIGDNKYPLVRLQNAKGNTPLHEAIAYRQEEVVSFLINLDQEVWFYLNNERKSPLYLAVEVGNQAGVEVMLSHPVAREKFNKWRAGQSPIHAAIRAKNEASAAVSAPSPVALSFEQRFTISSQLGCSGDNQWWNRYYCSSEGTDILTTLLEKEPRFIHVTNQEGLSPLQFAASLGYLNEVRKLLASDPTTAIERHEDGSLPIHMASMRGHDDIICHMLPYYPDHPMDILDDYGRNILHVAAMNGKSKVVSYILKNSQLHALVNERDMDGNTPLQLATEHWHPKIVSALTWYKGIDVNSKNSDECTALDIAEKSMGRSPSFRKRLTWTALKAAGASRCLIDNVPSGVKRTTSFSTNISSREHREDKADTLDTDKYKDRVNTLLLVSTLVATMTFAASFTMPGGYNDSEPDQGIATMLRNSKFHMFIFCDTIAMYSSILVALILILAQLGNHNLVLNALNLASPLLGISLATMCLAFMVGVSLMVGKLKWLNVMVLIIGLVFLVAITTLIFLLFLPISSSHNRIIRYMSYYPNCLLLLATGTNNEDLPDLATLPNNLLCGAAAPAPASSLGGAKSTQSCGDVESNQVMSEYIPSGSKMDYELQFSGKSFSYS